MVIRGKDLVIWVSKEEDGYLKKMAYSKSCTVGITAETVNITGKSLGCWAQKKVTRLNWNVECSNLFTVNSYDELFNLMTSMKPVSIAFTEDNVNGAMKYIGLAFITDINAEGDMDSAGQISVSLEGSGILRGEIAGGDFNGDFNNDFKIL